MRAICVDDEPMTLEYTVEQCRGLKEIDEVRGFTRASDALAWSRMNPVDIALLDIDMPDMDGITLAVELKQLRPDTAIIFLTAYKQFAYNSFAAHPSGYLLKPVLREKLEREVIHALSGHAERAPARVLVRTFGNFEVLVDGEPVAFARSKSKELLAYLIDRRGEGVSRPDAFSALWGDRQYDYSMQKQLDVYIRSLRDTLKAHGIGDIFELKRGAMRVFPERFECDMYRLLKGDAQAVNDYHGEYMRAYGWASVTEALLSEKHRRD